MTIITQQYAQQLIRDGKAEQTGETTENDTRYAIITRYDLQRVDHYRIDA